MTHTYEMPTQLHAHTTKVVTAISLEAGTSITVPGNSKHKCFFLQFKRSTESKLEHLVHSSEFVGPLWMVSCCTVHSDDSLIRLFSISVPT